jgi:hypothetical protein
MKTPKVIPVIKKRPIINFSIRYLPSLYTTTASRPSNPDRLTASIKPLFDRYQAAGRLVCTFVIAGRKMKCADSEEYGRVQARANENNK